MIERADKEAMSALTDWLDALAAMRAALERRVLRDAAHKIMSSPAFWADLFGKGEAE